jgi:KUP system potassium uptake protein
MPFVNWGLFVAIVLAVVMFRSSSNLAAAYGIAVTLDMLITTILTFFVIRYGWKYPLALCIAATGWFFIVDLAFFSSNMLKLFHGGWFPLVIGGAIFTLMMTWKQGRALLNDALRADAIDLKGFLEAVFVSPPARVEGTAVFLSSMDGIAPPALVRHVERIRMVHEQVVVLTIRTARRPFVPRGERTEYEDLGGGFHRVVATCGFMQTPNVPLLLEEAGQVEETFFALLSRNARHAGQYFGLPPEQVVEIGTQVDL